MATPADTVRARAPADHAVSSPGLWTGGGGLTTWGPRSQRSRRREASRIKAEPRARGTGTGGSLDVSRPHRLGSAEPDHFGKKRTLKKLRVSSLVLRVFNTIFPKGNTQNFVWDMDL